MADQILVPVILDLDQASLNKVLSSLDDIADKSGNAFSDLASESKKAVLEAEAQIKKLKKELEDAFDEKKLAGYTDAVDGLTETQKQNVTQAKKVVDSYDNQQEAVSALDAEIRKLQGDIKAGKKAQDTLIELNQKGSESYEALNKEIAEQTVKQKILREEKKRLEKTVNREIKSATALKGSYNDLVATTNVLRDRVKDFRVGIDGSSEDLAKLQARVRDNNTELKEFDKQLGDNFRNVGNYADGVKDVIINSEAFVEVSGELSGILGVLKGIYGQALARVQDLQDGTKKAAVSFKLLGKNISISTKAVKIFNTALKASVVVAVIALLASLVKQFSKTADGADSIKLVMLNVADAIGLLVTRIATFAKSFGTVISEMAQAVKFGLAFEFDKASEAIERAEAASASARGAFSGLGGALVEINEKNKKLIASERELNKLIGDTALQVAKLSRAEEERQAIADDATLSLDFRLKKAEEAFAATEKRIAAEIKLEEFRRDRIQEERDKAQFIDPDQDLGAFDNALSEQNAVIEEKYKDRSLALIDNAKRVREINSDIFEQDLDFLLDFFDRRKTILEAAISDETKAFSEREASFKQLQKLRGENFENESALFVKLAQDQADVNDKLSESDRQAAKAALERLDFEALVNEENAETLKNKVRELKLSEIAANRLRELIIEEQQFRLDDIETKKELDAQKLELEKELTAALEKAGIENIENLEERQRQTLELEYKTAQEELRINFGRLEDASRLNELLQELETKHQEDLNQIKIDGLTKRESVADAQLELETLRATNVANAEIKNSIKREAALEAIEKKALADKIARKEAEIEELIALAGEGSDEVLAAEIQLERLKQKQILDEQKKGQNKRLQEGAQFVADVLGQAAEQSRQEQENLQRKLDAQLENVEAQRKLAAAGAENTLAFEQGEADKRQKELLEEQKREQRILKAKAIFELFNNFISQGDGAVAATAKSVAGVAIVEAAAKLGDGTQGTVADEVKRQNGAIDSRGISRGAKHSQGGFMVEFEGSEGVLSGREMQNLGLGNFLKLKELASRGRFGLDILEQESNIRDETRRTALAKNGVVSVEQSPRFDVTQHNIEFTAAGDYIDTTIKNGFRRITEKKRTRLRG